MGIPTDDELDNQYKEAIEYSNDKRLHEQSVSREINRAELMLNRSLVHELNELRESIDKYSRRSRLFSIAMIILSGAILFSGVIQILIQIGILG